MKTRIITGLVLATVLLWLLYSAPLGALLTAVLLCATLSSVEFDRMFFPEVSRSASIVRQLRVVILIWITILSIRHGTAPAWIAFWCSFAALVMWYVVASDHGNDFPKSVREFGLDLLGYLYVVGLFGFILPIVEADSLLGRHHLFLLFLLVFFGDTAAYFVGVAFGRHRLAPHLSPKKSVEGAVGGVLGSTLAAVFWVLVIRKIPLGSPEAIKVLSVSPAIGILGQFGDLFESMLKRSQAAKDSGGLFPGHGGILDRVDGFLLAAPAFYLWLKYLTEAP